MIPKNTVDPDISPLRAITNGPLSRRGPPRADLLWESMVAIELTTKQKTIIVTGASQGIGAAVANLFLDRGYNVVGNSRNISRRAAALVQAGLGGRRHRSGLDGRNHRRYRGKAVRLDRTGESFIVAQGCRESPESTPRHLRCCDSTTSRMDRPFLYACWRVMRIPLADRLNRSPPVCECSLMTTPFSFLR